VWVSPKFAEGGAFSEGEAIARIDAADYQLAVTRARAQVAQAEEGLARETAESELARQDWAALGRGEAPPLAVREPQLAQARAMLASAQASLRTPQHDHDPTNIRAPFTGRMRERRANVGDYVGPGSPVAVMFSTETMEIRVPLTDADLASLRVPVGFAATSANPGPAAHVNIMMGGRILTWEGRLVRTEAAVDARTRLIYGIVEVRDPFSSRNAAPLAPGMFVTPHLTARANVALMARRLGRDDPARVSELAGLVRLDEALLDRYPSELSGGQRQRVSLMRALMLDPAVLLLDEPLGALDPMVRADLQRDLRDIFRNLKKTVVMVTHDLAEAAYFADHVVLMRDGRIEQEGAFKALIDAPATDFVRDFVNAQRELHSV
jgi:ABC-type Na+ transport system ATPase subunit NatA/biotin carboxyl carrier protein